MITDKLLVYEAAEPADGTVPSLRSLWKEAFGDGDEFLDKFFGHAYSPKRCRCIADGDKVVAALYWFDIFCGGKKWAYIYAVATAESHRGRGLCSFLMRDTHRHLAKLGYVGALLVPGERELFGFYAKSGYSVCSEISEIRAIAANTPCVLRRIDKDEYSRRRAELLPENGAVQEDENLDFLSTYANFYTGDGFVLAGHRQGSEFYGVELLGNIQASEILCALGADKGSFRGNFKSEPNAVTKPFAMSICFTPDTNSPSYFGLAFD